jgi:cytochrome P450
LIRDDEYEGYRFPAGTVVTINNWAISLNPNEYENPTKFDPDRFMNDDLWNPTKGHYGYGAGRRTCAGFRVAQNSMFIFFSRFIYCFDVFENKVRDLMAAKTYLSKSANTCDRTSLSIHSTFLSRRLREKQMTRPSQLVFKSAARLIGISS